MHVGLVLAYLTTALFGALTIYPHPLIRLWKTLEKSREHLGWPRSQLLYASWFAWIVRGLFAFGFTLGVIICVGGTKELL